MSGLPATIDDAESLTNFVVEAHKIKTSKTGTPYVHWRAFRPENSTGRWERSVFRTTGMGNEAVFEIGRRHVLVGDRADAAIVGWGTISAGQTRRAETSPLLDVQPDVLADEPPPFHAVIVHWSEREEQRKALAMYLASLATTHVQR